jgi:hypothetical protein
MAALLDGATGVLVDGKWRDTGAAEPVRDNGPGGNRQRR